MQFAYSLQIAGKLSKVKKNWMHAKQLMLVRSPALYWNVPFSILQRVAGGLRSAMVSGGCSSCGRRCQGRCSFLRDVVWVVRFILLVVVMGDGRSRKVLSLSLIRTTAHKHYRPIIIFLLHQGRVLEALQHGRLALDASVRDVADLVTVEHLPMLAVILAMKRRNVLELNKVHKCVTTVASVFEVNGQIEKVHFVRSVAGLGKFVQEHLLGVLVGTVAHHERGPCILPTFYSFDVKKQLRWIVIRTVPSVLPCRLVIPRWDHTMVIMMHSARNGTATRDT